MAAPLATFNDVQDIWPPLTAAAADEVARVDRLIAKASTKLRQKCPFDIDARVALFQITPDDPIALDPQLVADVVASIVKRFLANPNGLVATSEGAGPFSHTETFVSRYDKTGADTRGGMQVTDSDIEQLRPAVPSQVPSTIRLHLPDPQLLIPHGNPRGLPAVVPDVFPGIGAE